MSTTTAPAPGGKKNTRLPFAMGTTRYPVPIAGQPLVYSPNTVSTLSPIPKTGFYARSRYTVSGTITFGTAAGTTYRVPLWRMIANYTLQNSLAYPYRSLNSDDIWMSQQFETNFPGDPILDSASATNPDPTSTTANQKFQFSFTDEIWNNDGVNFSRYLLSAMNTSNDLTINITWANAAALQQNGAVISALSASIAVTAEYLTVPDPDKYLWPRRNLVQQMVGDPSFNRPSAGLNSVNLTPIQGPEFLGIGVQVLDAGVPDTLVPATSKILGINIKVNGSIPLYTYTLADLLVNYERMFGRKPSYGYLWLDFMNDLSIVNAMSHTHRKVLATSKYSQITIEVILASTFSGAPGSVINLFKRTQQMYAQNK